MQEHYQLSDQDFVSQFADGSLTPQWFTHEAHLRLAWILLRSHEVEQAAELLCRYIRNFDQLHGDGTKFNMTVTIAAAKAVDHFMRHSKAGDFPSFIAEHARLKTHFKDLLSTHYGVNIFAVEEARSTFLEPDKLPFD
ncbi:MAG: hypothetical protein AAFP92_00060 [Bacteroidota bacterium]